MAVSKEKYQDRKEKGLCCACGKKPAENGLTRCGKCAEKLRKYRKPPDNCCQYSTQCKRPLVIGKKCCQYHLDENMQRARQKRITATSQKLCSTCRKPLDGKYKSRCMICSDRSMKAAKSRQLELRDIVYNHYGGYKCKCCGETEPRFLSLDHTNNNGAQHRREIGNQLPNMYRWIITNNFPPTFQILCLNCNIGKFRNGGTCPHEDLSR